MSDDTDPRFHVVHERLERIEKRQDIEAERVTRVECAIDGLRGTVNDLRERVVKFDVKQDEHHEQTSAKLDAIEKAALSTWPGSAIKWIAGIVIGVMTVASAISLVVVSWLHP